MASYNELNALIDAYINRNGVQAITGQILNGVLKAMVEQIGRGYALMGIASPNGDPGTPDAPESYFASEPGTYTNFGGRTVAPGEFALLYYIPSEGWFKETIYDGFQTVQASIDGNVGTPSVGVSYANGVLSFDFHNMKGNPGQNGQDGQDGSPAGFGTIGADITGGVGTPGVTVESSGPATAKNLQFHFTNLKGETGVTSVVATVDNTVGTPACTVSLVGQQLTLAFTGLKGAQGDTGSSVDYPFTIVNNLTTDDATQALSAAQGVVLDGKVTQLEAEVTDIENAVIEGSETVNTTVDNYTPTSYAAQPFEDPRQVLPAGAKLLGINLLSTGTANSSRTQLRVYDSTRTLINTYTLDGIGATDTYMDVSAENIIIQEGYHYAIYRCGYKWVSGLNVFVRADTGNVENGSFYGFTFRYQILKTKFDEPIAELRSEIAQVEKEYPYHDQANYWVGKGSSMSENTFFTGLIPGRKYRIRPHATSWPTTSAPSGGTVFAIGTSLGDTVVSSLAVVYKGGTVKPYYDFVLPSGCDGFFCSGRADAGYNFWVSIYDMTGDLWAEDDIRATNAAAIKEKASYTMTFTAGAEHSSTSDQLLIRIPQGMTFVLRFVGTAAFSSGTVVPSVYYADGTSENLRSVTPGNNYVFTATKEIIAIGVYKGGSAIVTSGDLTLEIWNNEGRNGLSIFAVNNLDEVSEKLQQVNVGNNGVTLLHFSDIHGEQDNLSRIVQFAKHFGKYINDVVCTGDFVYNVFGDSFDFWDNAGAQSVIPAIGNHDVWIDGAGESSATIQQCYDKYIKDNIGNWGVQSPGDVCYFYKDYNNGGSYPVRLIVLDCMHIDATQISWIESVLNDARENGITVLIAAHYTPSVMAEMTLNRDSTFTAFAAQNTSTGYGTLQPVEDIVANFIVNGGKFACWLAGHYHTDVFGLSKHGQPVIVIDKSCIALPTDNFTREGGTKTQDLFNVISIDAHHGIIRICRIGNEMDKMMRPVETLSFNYVTKESIHNC